MPNSRSVHPRQSGTVPVVVPHASAFNGVNVVELPETGSSHPKADDAEILKAIGELHKKLAVLSKNQKAISDRLHHLEGLISNNSSNVVNGFVYMRWLMWAVAYWTCHEDDDNWGRNVPKEPHWH